MCDQILHSYIHVYDEVTSLITVAVSQVVHGFPTRLCCTAFEQKLQQRQSAYRSLLKFLHRWRSQLEKQMVRKA